MVLITILTLVLALLPVTERVEAVAAEMAVVYFVYATIFGSCAVSFATDENFRQGVKNFVGQASEVTKNIVNAKAVEISNNIASGLQLAGYKINFSAEEWKFITEDVNKYVVNAYSDATANITAGKDGTLGFTEDSQFSAICHGGTVQLTLSDYSMLTLDSATPVKRLYSYYPYKIEDWKNNNSQFGYCINFSVFPFDLQYYDCDYYCSDSFTFEGMLKSNIEAYGYKGSWSINFNFEHSTGGWGTSTHDILRPSRCFEYDRYLYIINGQLCYFTDCTDGKYRFVPQELLGTGKSTATDDTCVPLINHYTNKTYYNFDTANDMYYTVLDAAGLRHYTDSNKNVSDVDVYKAPAVPVSGSVPDVYTGTDDVTLTIPDSVTSVDDYAAIAEANPSDIISYEKAIEYPDGVPEIDSSGLFDKFPFCLPYDLYNVFAGFYTDNAVAPRFEFPFRYLKDDNGNYLIDENIVIDFAVLDDVVPILRFFISLGFVVVLIQITRKMIGA
mgnify:CR=1 FL=1